MKKILGITIFLGLIFTPFLFVYAQTSNAGFIPGNIWYSKDPFSEGDKVKIYTLIFNPDVRQLSGSVFFFDKTTFLGNKSFTIPGGSLKDISVDWTVTAGDHTIFGQIQNAKFLNSTGTLDNANLLEIKTSDSNRSVPKTIIPIVSNASTRDTSAQTSGTLDIPNFVKENTPTVVTETISTTSNAIENFRQNTGSTLDQKKVGVQEEIKNIENKKTSSTTNKDKALLKSTSQTGNIASNQGVFLKPFKYTELFALSLFSTVFNNKYIFYGLIVLLIFFIMRFIIRKFF